VTEIAMEIDIREHLQTCTLAVAGLTASDYSVALPDIFFKYSQRFTRARVDDSFVDIITLEELNESDPDHDNTTDGDTPDAVAIEGGRMYFTPLWSGTIVLENYFRKPVAMEDEGDSPDLPDDKDAQLRSLLAAGVLRKGFLWKQDLQLAAYYRDNEFPRLLNLYDVHLDKSRSEQLRKEDKFY
jgi:hypothetical protein